MRRVPDTLLRIYMGGQGAADGNQNIHPLSSQLRTSLLFTLK